MPQGLAKQDFQQEKNLDFKHITYLTNLANLYNIIVDSRINSFMMDELIHRTIISFYKDNRREVWR